MKLLPVKDSEQQKEILLNLEKATETEALKEESKKIGEIEGLKKEQSSLSQKILSLRLEEKARRKALTSEIQKISDVVKLKKSKLESEITILQSKRKELLEPVDAEIEKLKKRQQELNKRESKIKRDYVRFLEEKSDSGQILSEKEEELKLEEIRLISVGKQLGLSTKHLNQKWVEYHRAVKQKQEELGIREHSVAVKEQLLQNKEIELTHAKARSRQQLQKELNRLRKLIELKNGEFDRA